MVTELARGRPPIPLSGDSRPALRHPRPRPRALVDDGAADAARRGARDGGGRAPEEARTTATTPPTSRCSSPRRPACRRATWPRCSPSELAERRRGRRRRDRRPGFLNIRVEAGAQGARRRRRSSRPGRRTARSDLFAGEKVNLEFVSANPTGPIHIGGTRWAAVGDALGRVFDALRRRGHPGVLLQRPRRPDRPVRPVAAGQRARASRRPRTATAAQYIAEIADGRRRRSAPTCSTCPTTRRRRSSATSAST